VVLDPDSSIPRNKRTPPTRLVFPLLSSGHFHDSVTHNGGLSYRPAITSHISHTISLINGQERNRSSSFRRNIKKKWRDEVVCKAAMQDDVANPTHAGALYVLLNLARGSVFGIGARLSLGGLGLNCIHKGYVGTRYGVRRGV
jgi:hypothetical protein